jgi:hypothetical protein
MIRHDPTIADLYPAPDSAEYVTITVGPWDAKPVTVSLSCTVSIKGDSTAALNVMLQSAKQMPLPLIITTRRVPRKRRRPSGGLRPMYHQRFTMTTTGITRDDDGVVTVTGRKAQAPAESLLDQLMNMGPPRHIVKLAEGEEYIGLDAIPPPVGHRYESDTEYRARLTALLAQPG